MTATVVDNTSANDGYASIVTLTTTHLSSVNDIDIRWAFQDDKDGVARVNWFADIDMTHASDFNEGDDVLYDDVNKTFTASISGYNIGDIVLTFSGYPAMESSHPHHLVR